jgi:S1-C subfamily serine protease
VAGFGVFVSNRHVLTHTGALNGQLTPDIYVADGATTRARVVTYEPPSGLVLLEVETFEGRGPASTATDALTPGALAVAVGRSAERETAVPVFVTSVGREGYTIGAVDDGLLPGMPVFNLAGELLAVAAPDGQEVRAIPVRQAPERMLARASAGERRSSFGLGFQVPTGRLADLFGKEGVLISEVLPRGPADVAGIEVGDVLLAVGEVPIDSADTAARTLRTAAIGAATTLRIRRGARVNDVEAMPAGAFEMAALARSKGDAAQGPEARVLFPEAVLESTGIPPSARVLRVNGRAPTTRAQVERQLRLARQPVAVLLREGDGRFFAVVEPGR